MNLKAKIISEIDNLQSEYEAKENNKQGLVVGAINALLEPRRYVRDQNENQSPSDFCDSVISFIRSTPTVIGHSGPLGSDTNPGARQGMRQACDRLLGFVVRLEERVHKEGKE